MPLPIVKLLQDSGFITKEWECLFEGKCRDTDVPVFMDRKSGVIYLSTDFTGKPEKYYEEKNVESVLHPRNDMDVADAARREEYIIPLVSGKRWLDFGCGPGYQLRKNAAYASDHLGIELNKKNRTLLVDAGFSVSDDIITAHEFYPEVITMFHVFEHLYDPVMLLNDIYTISSKNAVLLIEVPHANDYLLKNFCNAFKKFTVWSEHVILHTRESLNFVVQTSAWNVREIIGVQRYPVWNHMSWMREGKPTGLQSSIIDKTAKKLQYAYEQYLAARGQTDTLLLYATKAGAWPAPSCSI